MNILFLLAFGNLVNGQTPDRKIIIEDGKYHCVTIDKRFQIGTLHIGDLDDTLLKSKAYALPAGRSLLYDDKPLSWDMTDSAIYAVNFLDHPMNDRNEAIKKIYRDDLSEWSAEVRPEAVIMHSVDNNMLAYNEPYKFAISRSKFMDSFYFDAVSFDGSYWMLIAHNDEMHCWNFKNGSWDHSEVIVAKNDGNFSLLVFDDQLKMVTLNGGIFSVGLDGVQLEQEKDNKINLNDGVIIEDRDNGRILILDRVHLDKKIPFNKLMGEFAITIYK